MSAHDGASAPAREQLAHRALREGLDDCVPLDSIRLQALALGASDWGQALSWSIAVIRELEADGLVRLGRLVDGRGWLPFERSAADVLMEVVRRDRQEGSDEAGYYLWLKLTPEGESRARQLESR